MKLNNVLKGKTRNQMLDDFMVRYPKPEHSSSGGYKKDLKKFAWGMRNPTKKIVTWSVSIFMWIFCLSWMIQAGIAMDEKFFWYPIDPDVKSMLSFINIFWVILWYTLPTALIVFYIVKVVKSYERDDSY